MGESWLLWCGGALAVIFVALLALAGMPFAGVFLGAVVWISARRALKPEARQQVDDELRRACDRLPFCDCSSPKAR